MKAWRDECAVFGCWQDPEASRMAYLGLYAQQHRGQESAGIVTCKDEKHIVHKNMGLVGDVFSEEDLSRLEGESSIGHVRYSTAGESSSVNAQPITAVLENGPVAIAHNGNIVNAKVLKKKLIEEGSIFQTTSDTECLLHMIAKHKSSDMIDCLKDSLPQLEGAFSLVFMTKNSLIAARDPFGFRPLVLGQRKTSDGRFSYVVASETCAFDLIGAQYVREIEPGEIFWCDKDGTHSIKYKEPQKKLAKCIFEHVYFARPDSVVFGQSVYETRKKMGRVLAQKTAVEADIVIPVPDSGVPAALGYSQESGVPFELGIIRNHYVGRTFIQPSQSIRSFGVKIKLNPQSEVLKGKRVIVIDDSLVRGTTSQKIIKLVRAAGAKEVHFRVASPPTLSPCFYGVDTPKKSQLIAGFKSVEEIRDYIGADTLKYMKLESMVEAASGERVLPREAGFCAACFGDDYPTDIYENEL